MTLTSVGVVMLAWAAVEMCHQRREEGEVRGAVRLCGLPAPGGAVRYLRLVSLWGADTVIGGSEG